jgi:hypothetical protein
MSDQSGFCASSRAFAQIWATRRPGPVSHFDVRGRETFRNMPMFQDRPHAMRRGGLRPYAPQHNWA